MTNVMNKLIAGMWVLGIACGGPQHLLAAAESRIPGAIVRVDQSYEKEWYGETTALRGVELPVVQICTRLLDASCRTPGAEKNDSSFTVAVTLKGIALGRAYLVFSLDSTGVGRQTGQSPSFSGAAVSGSIVLQRGGKTIRRDFSARKPLPDSVSRTVADTEAPFHEVLFYDGSLVPALLASITEISGATADNCAALKEELETLTKKAGLVVTARAEEPKTAAEGKEQKAVQDAMPRHILFPSHATVEVLDGKGGWKPLDGPVHFGPSLADRHKIVVTPTAKPKLANEPLKYRTWTARDGRTVDAALVMVKDGTVTLRKKSDGKAYSIPRVELSDDDQRRLNDAGADGNHGLGKIK